MNADNALSYSDLNSYGRCPAKYFFRGVMGIQHKHKDYNLHLGTLVHQGLQVFFLALRDDYEYEEAEKEVEAFYDEVVESETPLLFDDDEFAELMDLVATAEALVFRFLQHREDEIKTWTIFHVEEEFIAELDDGAVVTFTPDLVIEDVEGFVWIVDHKTTSKMPNEWGLGLGDMQALLYYTGVKALYPNLKGFIFSFMRKKLPTVPRLNKTHTKESKAFGHKFVNGIKNIDTTYEMLRDFLVEEAPELLGEPTHQQKLAELRDMNRFFWTETVLVSGEQERAIVENVSDLHAMMRWSKSTGTYPRVVIGAGGGYASCDRCEFVQICKAQVEGWDTDRVIEEYYEPREPKNPYETEEEL